MSHQDKDRRQVRYNAEQLKLALHWLLGQVVWGSIQFREDCTWLPLQLAATALVWAWSDELTLGDRFLTARRIAEHLYQPQREFATTPQAFLKLLRRWTGRLVVLIQACLRQRMQAALAAQWRLHDWIVFGVDGSRVELPRTRSHEAAYAPSTRRAGKKKRRSRRKRPCDAGHTKKARTPQLWLTMLWHAGTACPGPGASAPPTAASVNIGSRCFPSCRTRP